MNSMEQIKEERNCIPEIASQQIVEHAVKKAAAPKFNIIHRTTCIQIDCFSIITLCTVCLNFHRNLNFLSSTLPLILVRQDLDTE